MDKRIILGTAGHIDHGKTALVKALTGVDTDRLKEEKQRGITIELGFTSLNLPGGFRLGIVDMPGHEKFIDNMVAGAAGIDFVLMVVAADEGVMPQTVEHLEICRLLGIQTGMVAMTKVDLVDEEMQTLAAEDIADLVKGTFLEGKPVIPFSALTGEGKDALLEALGQTARDTSEKRAEGPARMPIDRVFTMKGFGTVVTGTLVSGNLSVGDAVEILPSGQRAKIRGLQVHNEGISQSAAGSRTAVNLQGIEKATVGRGEILTEPDRFSPTFRVFVHFHHLPHAPKPLPNRFRVMVHWGTARVLGRIVFLDPVQAMKPGESGFVQVQLEEPIFPVFGERVIARDFSTNRTLGGGVILDPQAPRFKTKFRASITGWLKRLQDEDINHATSYFFWKKGRSGASLEELTGWALLDRDEARQVLETLVGEGELVAYDPANWICVQRAVFEALVKDLLSHIQAFHRANPYQPGMPKESLRGKLGAGLPEKLLSFMISRLSEEGTIVVDRDRVRTAAHRIQLSDQDAGLRTSILEALRKQGVMPPTVKELCAQVSCPEPKIQPLLDFLATSGEITKISEELYYATEILEELKDRLTNHLEEKGEILAAEFKILSETTRKYTIPLLEYFDRARLTLRVGDRRVLRDKKS